MTGESTYYDPAGDYSSSGSAAYDASAAAQQSYFDASTIASSAAGQEDVSWAWGEYQDEQGNVYYYNSQTGQSQYERPY